MHPSELPDILKVSDTAFSLKLKKIYSDRVGADFIAEGSFLSLENALTFACSDGQYLIFICEGNACAFYCHEGQFVAFDSHSRDTSGLSTPNGKSIMLHKI